MSVHIEFKRLGRFKGYEVFFSIYNISGPNDIDCFMDRSELKEFRDEMYNLLLELNRELNGV